jgi:hypothetical protein
MKDFLQQHEEKIQGVLSCFDRLIFKGYLPWVSYASAMEAFLSRHRILIKDFKPFVLAQAERIKKHARDIAAKAGRPYIHLNGGVRMEERARSMAQGDGITRGLICVFAQIEPCRSYRVVHGHTRPCLASARRKCLFVYFYFLDRDFGLMHVKIQTWFPFQIQVYLNGHDWLANKMDRHQLRYQRMDNAFLWLDDPPRSQRLAESMLRQNWVRILDALACKANPLLRDLFRGSGYYWTISQCEYSTDVLFKDSASLQGLYKDMLQHATLCLSAEDVLTFLGKKLCSGFKGEVLTDFKHRKPGARVKHRVKTNWIKMYDKFGRVLRIETVIQHPYDFKIRRKGTDHGNRVVGWFPMCKRVTNLHRYREIALLANTRYLEAMAGVRDVSAARKELHQVCKRLCRNGRSVRALNPIATQDLELFRATLRGEHALMGFRNHHVRRRLCPATNDPIRQRRESARVSRQLKILHAHALIAKIPHSRRWRVTRTGHAFMGAAVKLATHDFPHTRAA